MQNITVWGTESSATTTSCTPGPRIVAAQLAPIEHAPPVHGVRLEAPSAQSVIEWVL